MNTNLAQICAQIPLAGHVLIWISYLVWEYVLGKTKFGSSVGLFIETPINKLMAYLHLN